MKPIDLKKQSNYIIVIIPENDRSAFKKSIQIAEEYIKKEEKPKVVLISEKYKNTDYKSIVYTQVQSFKKGTIRFVDKQHENDYELIISKISSLLKNGMLLIDDKIPFTDKDATILLEKNKSAQDVLIHRNTISLLDSEKEYIANQMDLIKEHVNFKLSDNYVPKKNIIFRLHDYPEFKINQETIRYLNSEFGEIHGGQILLAYFIARKKTIKLVQELAAICDVQEEVFSDFINHNELERLSKNYVYYNLLSSEIMEDKDFIKQCGIELISIFKKSQN